ncbi:MAG: long-chain-fatty-acid--CoA ligase [Gammaproteobacteria bacterium]|nr:long-chain-fatty-acid--CoA ligase [Gammaproteobacteria bacterium]
MFGLMQDHPLNISSLLIHVEKYHGDTEIVSKCLDSSIHRTNWKTIASRARQVANGLNRWDLASGTRIATLAWNSYRHLELFYGISCSGRVLHTINPRLHPDQISWMANHAEDVIFYFDITFYSTVQKMYDTTPHIRHYIALCTEEELMQLDDIANYPKLLAYETWINAQSSQLEWPVLDENSASSLCYTSGTTGNPKGVLYNHRSTILHAFTAALPDAIGLSATDTVLPVVPMFHVNAWGIPYAAAMVGAKLVFHGQFSDSQSLYHLLESEKVTVAGAVPTVWMSLLSYLQTQNLKFSTLNRTIIGGSACPPVMIQTFLEKFGVSVLHAWGMTEMSPIGTVAGLRNNHRNLSNDEIVKIRTKQGRVVFGVDIKIIDDDGNLLPSDGKSSGHVLVKGPWIIQNYFKSTENILDDGWFDTGDIACMDEEGYLIITDRSKDVIKSGGEWISSIDIENLALSHPEVAMAACIAYKDPKWDERPCLIVVPKPSTQPSSQSIKDHFVDKVAKWQIPDFIVFKDALPLGATGKILKTQLRKEVLTENGLIKPDLLEGQL